MHFSACPQRRLVLVPCTHNAGDLKKYTSIHIWSFLVGLQYEANDEDFFDRKLQNISPSPDNICFQ